jgi:hypothetical protein
VAPWYRWGRFPGTHPRDTPPVIQKYESTDLVKMFLADPQHCLKFTSDDTVTELLKGALVDTGRRKLYLPAHKRFYLVVCELHCDRPGFPNASRGDVCQAGFVIRRRRLHLPYEIRPEATRISRTIAKRRTQLAALERRSHRPPIAGGAPDLGPIALAHEREIVQRQLSSAERLEADRERLRALIETSGAVEVLEGWVPGELQGVGQWSEIGTDQVPAAGVEDWFRLSPLVPSAGAQHHAGTGHAMWFGMVPTGNADHEVDGTARFDALTSYEAQCFVRRHKPGCPRIPNHPPDCHGAVTWSVASETFSLAEHMDLVGTSNRPVTIQLPDIPKLVAQASSLAYGQGAPVRMAAPDGSSIQVTAGSGGTLGNATLGGAQICSLAIPLITIVATFVLRLFLPIVVFLLGLWALLSLRFCIPPDIGLSAGLGASVSSSPVGVEAAGSINTGVSPGSDLLNAVLQTLGQGAWDEFTSQGWTGDQIADLLEQINAGADAAAGVGAASGAPGAPGSTSAGPNSALAPLVWETEVPVP